MKVMPPCSAVKDHPGGMPPRAQVAMAPHIRQTFVSRVSATDFFAAARFFAGFFAGAAAFFAGARFFAGLIAHSLEQPIGPIGEARHLRAFSSESHMTADRRSMGTSARRLFVVAAMLAALMPAVPARALPHPSAPGCEIFPPDNVWHADVSALPVHARSGDWLAAMGGSGRHLHPDFGPSDLSQPYGIPYNVVAGSHAKVNVDFYYPDESDPGPYPLGNDTTIEMGSDRHALILDRDACVLYETYDTSKDTSGWHAGSGAVWDLASNDLRPAGWTSADAAGLPIFPGLIRRDEIAAGVIDHPIRVTASQTDRSYIWPARHQAGARNDASLPPMGAWFRLKSGFDLSGYSSETRVILTAFKKHGLILADNGSNWFFGGAAEHGWSDTVLDELKSITAGSFEAVDTSSLMVDPNSARIATGPAGSITASVSPGDGVWGTAFTATGVLSCNGVAVPAATVSVTRTDPGGVAVALGSSQTNAQGVWSRSDTPATNASYRARWAGGGECTGGATSPGAAVTVRPGVTVNAWPSRLARGGTATFSGRVLPAKPGKRVLLQVFNGGAGTWHNVAWATLDGSSSYRVGYRRTGPGWLMFRVGYPTQDAWHGWNLSRNVRVDWT